MPKYRWSALKSSTKFLRYANGKTKTPGMRWIGFDPECYIGLSPDKALTQAALDGVVLASDEVLTASFVFPKWLKQLDGRKWHFPSLSAYQFNCGFGWQNSPYLFSEFDRHRIMVLCFLKYGEGDSCSSPVIRELN